MYETIKITMKRARPILARTFPRYKGRKIRVEIVDKVHIYDTNWSEGSRNQYAALQHDGSFKVFSAPAPGSTIRSRSQPNSTTSRQSAT